MTSVTRIAVLSASICALSVSFDAAQTQPRTLPEEFNAIYTNISNVGATGALPVIIRIRRWTGENEHVSLMRRLEKDGTEALVRDLQDAKSAGSIGTPQDLPYDLRYARQSPLEEAGDESF